MERPTTGVTGSRLVVSGLFAAPNGANKTHHAFGQLPGKPQGQQQPHQQQPNGNSSPLVVQATRIGLFARPQSPHYTPPSYVTSVAPSHSPSPVASPAVPTALVFSGPGAASEQPSYAAPSR